MPASAGPPHLIHAFSTFEVGGQQVRFVTLANHFGRTFRHTLMAMDNCFTCAERLGPNVDFAALPITVAKSAAISLGNLARFRLLLGRLRPNLLLTYNWGAIEWALANRWLPRCRHLHFEDGFGPDESPTRQNRRRVMMRRLALSGRHTRVIVPSRTLHHLATETWQLSAARVIYLPNGIDCTRFGAPPDPALLAKFGLDRPGPVVGTVATLRAEKNIPRLVRAFAALPPDLQARLVVVGAGPERSVIEASAKASGLADRIILTGALDRPEAIVGRFDVFALSSDTEQMPYSVLEGMAAGLPVVAADVGDIKHMVANENAPFLVAPSDEISFTEGICRLLSDHRLREALGARNRARVRETYSLDAMLARYAAVLADGERKPI
jgi:glycosyltransferase involved in cell wall biosynthesis